MANLNKVMLIGRLTRDPEVRTFPNGGKIAQFGFAVNNSRKDGVTGKWVDEPVYLDIDAFNRENGRKFADLAEQYLKKGKQVYIEGRLKLDQWQDKQTGEKKQKLKVVMEECQFLDGGKDGSAAAYLQPEPPQQVAEQPPAQEEPKQDEIPF